MDFLTKKLESYYLPGKGEMDEEDGKLVDDLLLKSAEAGNVPYVKFFLSKGGDPNYRGITLRFTYIETP